SRPATARIRGASSHQRALEGRRYGQAKLLRSRRWQGPGLHRSSAGFWLQRMALLGGEYRSRANLTGGSGGGMDGQPRASEEYSQREYREIGIAYASVPHSEYGRYWVQEFGAR